MSETPWRPLHWVQQVARHAAQMPQATALWHGDRRTTWRELDERSRRLATALRGRGVGAGDRVLLISMNRPEFIETLLAVHRLGAVLVPVNFRLTAAEVDHIARDCDAAAVVIDAPLLAGLAEADLLSEPTPRLLIGSDCHPDVASGDDYEGALESNEPAEANGPSDLNSLAFVMYTSGTTGRPKGAMLSYQNLLAQTITAMCVLRLVGQDEVGAITSPFFHIAAIGHIVPSLILGHPMVLVPSGKFDPDEFLDLLAERRITSAFLVPSLWQRVCEAQTARPRPLALRQLAWGAEPAAQETLDLMARTFPEGSICSSFGQTEMSPITLVVTGEESRRKLGSVGRPVPMAEVRVVDAEMRDVPVGQIGEIVYRGPGTTLGYWNAPDATTEAFRGGWFHSGDLVRVDDDGYVYMVDRLKDMIISGGENIYSAEVEQAIQEHPQVAEVAVVAQAHPRWGETPVAFVVPTQGDTPPDEAAVLDFCGARLARYKLPSRLVFVSALPRNASGKILKTQLRELLASDVSSAR